MTNWDTFDKKNLKVVNDIIKKEMFNKGGQELLNHYLNHDLGSYWIIEFIKEVYYLLTDIDKNIAQKWAKLQINTIDHPVYDAVTFGKNWLKKNINIQDLSIEAKELFQIRD